MTSTISLHRLTNLVFWTILALYILHIFSASFRIHQISFPFSQYLRIFSLDVERGIGTWVSSLLHLSTAFSCYCASKIASAIDDQKHWLLISRIFCLSSLEEVAAMHEDTTLHFTSRFELPVYLKWAWVIIAIPVVLALTSYFARWVFRQNSKVRNNLCFAAFLFLTGAIGMEMIGSAITYTATVNTYSYAFVSGLEESMEMAGIIWMVRTVSIYMSLSSDSSNALIFRISA